MVIEPREARMRLVINSGRSYLTLTSRSFQKSPCSMYPQTVWLGCSSDATARACSSSGVAGSISAWQSRKRQRKRSVLL